MNQTTQMSDPEAVELSEEQVRKMAGVSGTIALGVGWAFLYQPSQDLIYGAIVHIHSRIFSSFQTAESQSAAMFWQPTFELGATLVGAALIAFALLMFAIVVVSRYAPDKSVVR